MCTKMAVNIYQLSNNNNNTIAITVINIIIIIIIIIFSYKVTGQKLVFINNKQSGQSLINNSY